MDSLITAAARALARGDPLAALDRIALRDDPPALALRGTAMAQLGDFERARELLEGAIRAFGPSEGVAQARCVIALAEVVLASRHLPRRGAALEKAIEYLDVHGDSDNALYGRLVSIRQQLLFGGRLRAEEELTKLSARDDQHRRRAFLELTRAELFLRRAAGRQARVALLAAREAAANAGIALLGGEIERALGSLDKPAARSLRGGKERALCLEEVEKVLASGEIVIDGCSRRVISRKSEVRLTRRPVLFALIRELGLAWPEPASREQLIFAAFEVKRSNETHRARLRVEMGRLRSALSAVAKIEAVEHGYQLIPSDQVQVIVLTPPIDGSAAELVALLSDGERWSTSSLALAAGVSQRSVQRALALLEEQGQVRSVGRGRTQRWLAPPPSGFTTVLLLASLGASE